MSSLRSQKGCMTCRKRRKKCDEKRPVCDSCVRLNLQCSYDPSHVTYRGARKLGRAEVMMLLIPTDPGDCTAPATFDFIRQSTLAFYVPTCQASTKDLSNLWQIAFDDKLVRDSLTACFSVVRGSRPNCGLLDRQVYGRTLAVLRHRMEPDQLTDSELLSTSIAVNFLGLMEV